MNAGNEASGVIVCQTDYRKPDGWILLGRRCIENSSQGQEREEEPIHAEQITPTAGSAQMFNFRSLDVAAEDKKHENL
jgi:hypothetical protein